MSRKFWRFREIVKWNRMKKRWFTTKTVNAFECHKVYRIGILHWTVLLEYRTFHYDNFKEMHVCATFRVYGGDEHKRGLFFLRLYHLIRSLLVITSRVWRRDTSIIWRECRKYFICNICPLLQHYYVMINAIVK